MVDRGAQILGVTSEWELIRFKALETGVIYQNSKKRQSFSGPYSRQAWDCFLNAKPWDGRIRTVKRVNGSKTTAQLMNRDGVLCFYCGLVMHDEDMTREHLLSVTCGGNNHLSNLCLAHQDCNNLAGNLSIVEKVELRERLRNKSRGA